MKSYHQAVYEWLTDNNPTNGENMPTKKTQSNIAKSIPRQQHDLVQVPRNMVRNVIAALTTKPEFVRQDMLMELVKQLSQIADPQPQQPTVPPKE